MDTDRNRLFWDRSWGSADAGRTASYIGQFDPAEDRIIHTLKERGRKHVCDAGCGCGVYSLKLARYGFWVSGFDIAEQAVLMAQKLLSDNGYPAADFRRADILFTGYENERFDAVVARDVIDHLPFRQGIEAVRELLRIVRPGGCVLLTLDASDEEYESEPHTTNEDGDYLYFGGKWDGMVFHPYSPGDIGKLAEGLNGRQLPLEDGGRLVVLDR